MTIEELLAREAIRKTLANYTLHGDRGNIEQLVGCFAPDGVLEFVGEWRAEGRTGIRDRTSGVTDQTRERRAPLLRHHLGTHGVELDSPIRARAWTYFSAYTEIGPDHMGRYVDRLRRDGDEWLIEYRRIVVEWWSPDTIYRDQARRAGAELGTGRDTDVEAIRQLKARYFRLMDLKRWDEYEDLYTEDAVMDVREDVPGAGLIQGRKAIVSAVSNVLAGVLTVHQGHMPEIEITGPTRARGTWTLEDWLEYPAGHSPQRVHGRGLYHEEYEKCADGRWRIRSLQLLRLRLERDGKREIPGG